jgi:hypothetical protein
VALIGTAAAQSAVNTCSSCLCGSGQCGASATREGFDRKSHCCPQVPVLSGQQPLVVKFRPAVRNARLLRPSSANSSGRVVGTHIVLQPLLLSAWHPESDEHLMVTPLCKQAACLGRCQFAPLML